jgi:hypothetical protein
LRGVIINQHFVGEAYCDCLAPPVFLNTNQNIPKPPVNSSPLVRVCSQPNKNVEVEHTIILLLRLCLVLIIIIIREHQWKIQRSNSYKGFVEVVTWDFVHIKEAFDMC